MRGKILVLTIGLFGAILLGGCNLPAPCTSDMLVQPQLQSPAMWEVVESLTPSLSWTYPTYSGSAGWKFFPTLVPAKDGPTPVGGGGKGGPTLVPGGGPTLVPGGGKGGPTLVPGGGVGPFPYPIYPFPGGSFYPGGSYPGGSYPGGYPASNCYPSGYQIKLSTGPEFNDDLGGSSSETNWTTPTLLPGTEYAWGVRATSSSGSGPFAGYRYFFTGPICECDPDTLLAPDLLGPTGGVSSLDPSLIWDYPGECAPLSYRVDLSTDPEFGDTSLSGGTGNPSTRWGPGEDLEDCTTYYWRIAVACETPSGETILGPYSETKSFSTVTAFCALPELPSIPHFIPHTNANCRLGPSQLYNRVAVVDPEVPLEILGRNETSNWFLVQANPNLACWLSEVTGDTDGDPLLTPVGEYPPLPERKTEGSCEEVQCPRGTLWDAAQCQCVSGINQPPK